MFTRSAELTIEAALWNPDIIEKLMGIPPKEPTYTIKGESVIEVKTQIRKHKKKRINKKWAKRYGFDVQHIPYEFTFHNCVVKEDGSITVLGGMTKDIKTGF